MAVRPFEVTPQGDPTEHAAQALSRQVMGMSEPVGKPAARQEGVPGGLDGGTRTFFESRFGTDLRHVRVHEGPEAARSAAKFGAAAYTFGADLVMGAGRQVGPNLLTAHELAHVVQGDAVGRVSRAPTTPGAFRIISKVWRVSGRDIVLVATGSGDQVLSFYRRRGLGYKGVGVAPEAGQWVPFKTLMEQEENPGKPWFNKRPYYTQVGPDDPLRGYGNTRNKAVGEWLDSQQIQPGVEAESWEAVEQEMDQVAASYKGSTPGGGGSSGGGTGGALEQEAVHEAEETGIHPGALPKLRPPKLEGGFWSRRWPAAKSALREGLGAAFSAENIVSAIPEVVLAIADKVAAREAIRTIKIKFAKEGFAKGVAAGVMRWSEDEVRANLKNRVTSFRVRGLEDPAGFLTSAYIFQIAEVYENYAVDLGYRYCFDKPPKWKNDLQKRGFEALARYGYNFGLDEHVLFDYEFIDKLAWVLRSTTDPIVDEAIEQGEERKEAKLREAQAGAGGVGRRF